MKLELQITNNQSSLIDNHLARHLFTRVENTLQISPFMPNKPNFWKVEIDASSVFTNDYKILWLYKSLKNKANQTQFKPNWSEAQVLSAVEGFEFSAMLICAKISGFFIYMLF